MKNTNTDADFSPRTGYGSESSTPGPWLINRRSPTLDMSGFGIEAKGGNNICAWVDKEANARLIAAAPDLLAACELALKYLRPLGKDHFSETAEQTICAAIAKARAK